MRIKIIKSNFPTYWYAHKIGQEFDVREIGNVYVLEETLNTAVRSLIDKDDAELIKEVWNG